jgi:DNA modification methylase
MLCADVPAQSVDFLFSDPPYDMTTSDIKTPPLRHGQKEVLAKNFKRVLKPTGNLVLFTGLKDKFIWRNLLIEEKFVVKHEIVMAYEGGIKHDKRFLPAHETATHYILEPGYYFHGGELFEDVYHTHRARGLQRNKGYDYRGAPKERVRVTPKPLGLAQKLIEVLCPPGGVVFDPFAGIATFGVAAIETKRQFIGFEIDREIYALGAERLRSAIKEKRGANEWW